MNTKSKDQESQNPGQSKQALVRQDLEALLANLNSFEAAMRGCISRLREDILTAAVHHG
jgi:hypothetical protein